MATKTSAKVKSKDPVITQIIESPIVTDVPSPNDEAIRNILKSRISDMQENIKILNIQKDNITAEISAIQQGIVNCEYLLTKSSLNISDFIPT
jgi:hypothetical protein